MKLTVELEHGVTSPEVALCFDAEGLCLLLEKLEYLKSHIDHLHLKTPSWAGDELTEEKLGGDDYELVNHLRLVRVTND